MLNRTLSILLKHRFISQIDYLVRCTEMIAKFRLIIVAHCRWY